MNAPWCVLIGGGGHACVVVDALQCAGELRSLGVVDADAGNAASSRFGLPYLGTDAVLPQLIAAGTTHFVVALGSVGDARRRSALFELACAAGLAPLTVRHPSAVVSRHATIAGGAQLMATVVVNPGASIGANAIVNTAAVVEHDCVVGEHVHLATGARLCGNVTVEPGAHVGAGAVVRQGLRIGAAAVVGAGAVVVTDVVAAAVVAGVPAKDLRP